MDFSVRNEEIGTAVNKDLALINYLPKVSSLQAEILQKMIWKREIYLQKYIPEVDNEAEKDMYTSA